MVEGGEPPWTKEMRCQSSLHKCTSPDFQTIHELALNSRTIGEIYNIYVCLYKEQTTRKIIGSCVTLRYNKNKMVGCTIITVLEYIIYGMHA